MSTFGNDFQNNLLLECENASREGIPFKEIVKGLLAVAQYILEYWL